jgi:hypothetical protein
MTLGKCCHICKRVICSGFQRIAIKKAQSVMYLTQIGLNSPTCFFCALQLKSLLNNYLQAILQA